MVGLCHCCGRRPVMDSKVIVSNYCVECAGRILSEGRCSHDDNFAYSAPSDEDK